MPRLLTIISLVIGMLIFEGCNKSNGTSQDPIYTGVWDVQYNFVIDDCGLALEGIPGFFDQHTINQMEKSVNFDAKSGLIFEAVGQIRSDNSMFVNQSFDGDIFGDGIFCTLSTTVSYEPPDSDDKSETLFSQTIVCVDGYECESQATGRATRQEIL